MRRITVTKFSTVFTLGEDRKGMRAYTGSFQCIGKIPFLRLGVHTTAWFILTY